MGGGGMVDRIKWVGTVQCVCVFRKGCVNIFGALGCKCVPL